MQQEKEDHSEKEETDPVSKYRASGKVAGEVLNYAVSLVREGAKLIDICTQVENRIRDLGCEPAFPTNISIDHVAAHYTSPPNDATAFKAGQLVKIDVGAHLDGFIGDAAQSLIVGEGETDLIRCTEEALKEALAMAGPKVMTNDIGKRIEEVIRSYGFVPIRQLSGHTLEQYIQHGGKTIPNFSMPHGEPLEVGEAYGMDIFASNGTGNVTESALCHIYAVNVDNPFPRLRASKRLYGYILENYRTLPFAERWYKPKFPASRIALLEMLQNKALRRYGVLSENRGVLVGQSEDSFVVTENGVDVTTRP